MRVAVVTSSYPLDAQDPSGHFVHAEVALLAQRAEVDVYFPAPPGALQPADPPGVRAVPLDGGTAFGAPGLWPRLREHPSRLGDVLRAGRAVRHALHNARPYDELVAHWLVPVAWPLCAGPFWREPSAISEARLEAVAHGSDVDLLCRSPRPLARRILADVLTRPPGARVRFVAAHLRDRLATHVGGALADTLRAHSTVQPCAIDVGVRESRAAAREALGVGADERVAVIVGRLVPSKDVGAAISACRARGVGTVWIIGDGPEKHTLAVRFPWAQWFGALPRSETLRRIRAASVLVSASLREGAPTAIREALAVGTPVAAAPWAAGITSSDGLWIDRDLPAAVDRALRGGKGGPVRSGFSPAPRP